jgi:glycosyltransferase involved in cell wall biosynthesis
VKILLVHNSYQQPGGEDQVVLRELALLLRAGHDVSTYFRHNEEIRGSMVAKIAAGPKATWARDSHREVAALLKREKPDLAHFHNIFPLISPSAYYACADAHVPVVQTLHNYRLACPAGTFFRNCGVCEECLDSSLWRSVTHGCYRDSRLATAALAFTLTVHRKWGTWTECIDSYLAPTDFVRCKLISAGICPDKVFVKPHFVDPDPGERRSVGDYAIFVGRLTIEKGLRTLVRAWSDLARSIPLLIVGDGPLRGELERQVAQQGTRNVGLTGHLGPEKLRETIRGARFLVFPSEWYETFGLTIVEAFAFGIPVICSGFGAMQELVENGRTGLHFLPGDSDDLAAKVVWAWSHCSEMRVMGRAARVEYETKYTAGRNYPMIIDAYQRAMQVRTAVASPS